MNGQAIYYIFVSDNYVVSTINLHGHC